VLVEVGVKRFPTMETRVKKSGEGLKLAGIISGEQVRSFASK
jgi:hypothetical protein